MKSRMDMLSREEPERPRPKTVVITGASAGIGRAAAERFAQAGYAVGLISRETERLYALADWLGVADGRALALPADVADANAVEEAAARAEAILGPIDVWVNSAMATVFSEAHAVTAAEYKRVAEVTYLGSVHGVKAALRRMQPRNSGVIIQVGSALAHRSIPLQSAYCAAKHAILGFLDSLRSELIRQRSNVALSMVHLPAVNTPQFDWARNHTGKRMQPFPPIFQPEVAAEAIFQASLRPVREFWLSWPVIRAALGQRLVPGWLDRRLARTGYENQLTAEDDPPDRPDNLFAPVGGAFGSHGRFDRRARNTISLGAALVGGGWTGLAVYRALRAQAAAERRLAAEPRWG